MSEATLYLSQERRSLLKKKKKNGDQRGNSSILSGKALIRLFFLLPQLSKWPKLIHGCITLELRGGTLTRTKWRHFMSWLSMLWLCTFQMGLVIYVSLLLLTPKALSLPFDPQEMPSCPGVTPTPQSTISLTAGSAECSPLHQWKSSRGGHLHFKERILFNSVMTSNNPRMDWCNYGHNVTFNFDFNLG